MSIKEWGEIMKLISHPVRFDIIKSLGGGQQRVGDIIQHTKKEAPEISRHLKMLYIAGIVSKKRDGTFILYNLTTKLFSILEHLKNYNG